MAVYSMFFTESVRKECERIPAAVLRRIMERKATLAKDPRGHGCEKLSRQEKYRVRQGDWRMLYSIQNEQLTVCVVKVGHLHQVYRA